MDDRNERIAAALERLFRTYPQSDRGDALDVALDRLERAKVYLEAVDQFDIADIEAATKAFITGNAPGVNPAFIPPAPQVAAEVRRQMNLRLDSERRRKPYTPELPPPRPTAESRARVKALIDNAVVEIAAKAADTTTPESQEGRKAIFERTNERLDAERGFEVGDPEGAADAA